MEAMTSHDYTRRHFRISYPVEGRPTIFVTGSVGEVLDLSETGVRFFSETVADTGPGETLRARIEFADGRKFDVCGKVVRIQDHHFAMELDTPLPQGLMMAEHRELIQKYPDTSD